MKKPEGSGAVVLENLPDDVNQDVLTLLVENISSLSENDFSMELIPELRKAVVTFKNPIGKLFYSYKNIITFVICIITFTFSQKNINIYIINNTSCCCYCCCYYHKIVVAILFILKKKI